VLRRGRPTSRRACPPSAAPLLQRRRRGTSHGRRTTIAPSSGRSSSPTADPGSLSSSSVSAPRSVVAVPCPAAPVRAMVAPRPDYWVLFDCKQTNFRSRLRWRGARLRCLISRARMKRRLVRFVLEASQEHQPTCPRPLSMGVCSGAAGQRQHGSCSWLRHSSFSLDVLPVPH